MLAGSVGFFPVKLNKDALDVVVDGMMRPGVIAYGVQHPDVHTVPAQPRWAWNAPVIESVFTLHGEGWRVIAWVIPVDDWPAHERWTEFVLGVLHSLVDAGCAISWVSSEGFFCDPPDLLLPATMSGSVVAGLAADGRFWPPADPYGPVSALSDVEMLELREASGGLAGATSAPN